MRCYLFFRYRRKKEVLTFMRKRSSLIPAGLISKSVYVQLSVSQIKRALYVEYIEWLADKDA